MARASSPLRLILALHPWILRIMKLQCAARALAGILRRLTHLWCLCRSKLHFLPKGNDKPPKDELTTLKDHVEGGYNGQKPYTIIRHGDTISLDKASLSRYPFSSSDIRNTSRSSIRLGNPPIRSQNPSVYPLPLYPPTPSSSGNLPHQASASISDRQSPISSSRLWNPIPSGSRPEQDPPQTGSPTPKIEAASQTLPKYQIDTIIQGPYRSERDRRYSLPLGTDAEPLSPITEVNSLSQTSLQGPSSSTHSASHPHPFKTSHTSLDITVNPIPLGPIFSHGTDDENHTIRPVMPDETKRYSRRTRTRRQWSNLAIDPITVNFEKPGAPGGWLMIAHPEGARYFHHPEKRVYTESDLYDPQILDRIMDDIARLERLALSFGQSFPENVTLMVDVDHRDDGGFETLYYYADHDERAIFFLHPLESWDVSSSFEINGIRTYHHLGYEMQSQYWYFVSLYPDSLDLTVPMVCELRDIVLYLIGDTMTSPFSTAPYPLDGLLQILNLTSEMEKNSEPGYPGTMAHFARHMYIFYHTRFINFHGESYARIERDFSVFGDPLNERTLLVKTLSLFLFSAPDIHLRNLQKMWVDGIMHQSIWKETMTKWIGEWQNFIFFATIILISNVGFLSIQSVDTDDGPFRSDAQILSYLSVVANTGTIILGLLLMRQNHTKARETADDVQRFLTRRNHPGLGLETLAILYSLPYALLMWGVVALLGAFCCVFFQDSNTQTRSLVGALAVAVAISIIWCIITSWDGTNVITEEKRPLSYEEQKYVEFEGHPSAPHKYSIFDKIRSLPAVMYIRSSLNAEETTVV